MSRSTRRISALGRRGGCWRHRRPPVRRRSQRSHATPSSDSGSAAPACSVTTSTLSWSRWRDKARPRDRRKEGYLVDGRPTSPRGWGCTSATRMIPASNGYHGPHGLDHAERPCPREESVDAGEDTPGGDAEDESTSARLECIHRHHEGQRDDAKPKQAIHEDSRPRLLTTRGAVSDTHRRAGLLATVLSRARRRSMWLVTRSHSSRLAQRQRIAS